MAIELSYVLITPHSIVKSRTGGIIARILSRTDVELVSAQIFAPEESLVQEFADSINDHDLYGLPEKKAQLFRDYILENLMPSDGRRHRTMLLLFKGEDAREKIYKICGGLYEVRYIDHGETAGETVRDTYADIIWADKEKTVVKYFEPAVIVARTKESIAFTLKMFSKYLKTQPNIVENMKHLNPVNIERTLVIIKPDNWNYASSRPGSIIDMFSRTGLRIIGCKMFRMSVAQALEFYGPVKDVLIEKLSESIGEKAIKSLEKQFDFHMTSETRKTICNSFGKDFAVDQFESIVEFMSGTKPSHCQESELEDPGKVKCMVLIYEGENAVDRIRQVLGATDPTKAEGGTIRKEFGSNVMVNSAHASDSAENAKREMGIIKVDENTLSLRIDEFFEEYGET